VAFPAGHPMGIDLEAIDAQRLETLRSQMSKFELAWAETAEGGEAQNCTLVWTAKEALSKVLKCGLMSPMEVLGLCDLEPVGKGRWEGHYQNFPQYKCLAWATESSVLAITLPKNSTLVSDLALTDSLF
jgi:4'-phosphopantetheinyl transferase